MKTLMEVMKHPTKVHRNPLFPHMECDCTYPHDRIMCSRDELKSMGFHKQSMGKVDPCQCSCHDEHESKK